MPLAVRLLMDRATPQGELARQDDCMCLRWGMQCCMCLGQLGRVQPATNGRECSHTLRWAWTCVLGFMCWQGKPRQKGLTSAVCSASFMHVI